MSKNLKNMSRALVIACALAPLPALADTVQTDTVVEVQQTAPRAASQQDSANYQQRDQKDKDAQQFEGGAVVVFAASGAVLLALLLMLLII
jgi:hypothetical protein